MIVITMRGFVVSGPTLVVFCGVQKKGNFFDIPKLLLAGMLSQMQKRQQTGLVRVKIGLCQGKILAWDITTHHELSVRKFQLQTILCGYFGLCVWEAALQEPPPELVRVSMGPLLCPRDEQQYEIFLQNDIVSQRFIFWVKSCTFIFFFSVFHIIHVIPQNIP